MGVSSAADSIAAIGAKEHPAQAAIFRAMAIAFAVLASAIVVLFGWLANRRYIAFFAIGMVLYLLDGLLLLLFRQWLSVGFHAFVLFCMFGGLMAYRQLNQIEETLGHRAARRSLSHRDEGFDAESQKNY
jgi:intracellular septation protein A